MPLLVSDIFTGVRALVNDMADEKYHDADLLPIMQLVYADFLLSIDNNDLPNLNEISTAITVNAGVVVLPLPSDFKTPLKLMERAAGSTDLFQPMTERDFEPERTPITTLSYWAYREDSIQFLGATTNREVKLFYVKDLTIAGVNSVIPIIYADVVLKYWVAAEAMEDIGENYPRADRLFTKSSEALQKFLNRRVKGRQAYPIRRPGFRERRKNNYLFR